MFRRCSPIIPVSNIEEAVLWFDKHLGFQTSFVSDKKACLKRDDATLWLILKAPDMDLQDERRQQSCYIDVLDVDAVYEERATELNALPRENFRAPFDQDYGQREFHVIYEGLLIFIGASLRGD